MNTQPSETNDTDLPERIHTLEQTIRKNLSNSTTLYLKKHAGVHFPEYTYFECPNSKRLSLIRVYTPEEIASAYLATSELYTFPASVLPLIETDDEMLVTHIQDDTIYTWNHRDKDTSTSLTLVANNIDELLEKTTYEQKELSDKESLEWLRDGFIADGCPWPDALSLAENISIAYCQDSDGLVLVSSIFLADANPQVRRVGLNTLRLAAERGFPNDAVELARPHLSDKYAWCVYDSLRVYESAYLYLTEDDLMSVQKISETSEHAETQKIALQVLSLVNAVSNPILQEVDMAELGVQVSCPSDWIDMGTATAKGPIILAKKSSKNPFLSITVARLTPPAGTTVDMILTNSKAQYAHIWEVHEEVQLTSGVQMKLTQDMTGTGRYSAEMCKYFFSYESHIGIITISVPSGTSAVTQKLMDTLSSHIHI